MGEETGIDVEALAYEAGVEMESQALARDLESMAARMRHWTRGLHALKSQMEHLEPMMRGGASAGSVARESERVERMAESLCSSMGESAPESVRECRASLQRLMQACGMGTAAGNEDEDVGECGGESS